MAHDLIVVAEDWGGLPSSTQHLIRNLPGNRRILWVNSLGMRRPRLTAHDIKRLFVKARDMLTKNHSKTHQSKQATQAAIPQGMEVMAPRAIPWPGLNLAYKINKYLLRQQIRARASAMGLENPLLWISFPTGLATMGAGLTKQTLYYCADDYGAIAGVDHQPALEMEKRLIEKADLILATSETLLDKFPADKTRLLLHGVDVEKFQTPAPRAPDLPNAPKIAGFYGSFLDRIDVQMLRQAARDLPDWQFVFIGRVEEHESAPLALPNVTFLGSRPHDELASYVQHWTVSLLPFRDCAMVRAMNPLKLREYLAAGTPIASVEFPALAPYRHLVSTAQDRKHFASAILQAATQSAENDQRRESIKGESWSDRARQADEILETL